MPCFDASGIQFLPQSLYLTYQSQWATFERIYNFNSNISTLQGQGTLNLHFYQFKNGVEQTDYLKGQFLHTTRYPNSNWDSPQNS